MERKRDMKRIVVGLLALVAALGSPAAAQTVPAAPEQEAPQALGTTPFFGANRAFSARPAGGFYPLIDYTDPYGTDDAGVWDYPFQTYGIDYDFDGFYEPPNPYGLQYPAYLPSAAL